MKFVSKMFLILVGLALCSAAPESANRISNGIPATSGQFPYMASLQKLGAPQNLPTRGHSCAGALVSYRHVVTTAFCLHNYTTGFQILINPSEYRVFAGSNLLNNDTSGDLIRPILSLTVHPNFSGLPALVNNIAVITVLNEFPKGVVKPLALPSSNFNPAEFTMCTVAGWGSVDTISQTIAALRFAEKYVYNQNICTLIYNTAPDTINILPSMICAASHDLRSSNCFGDYGNPLVCGNTFTGVLSISHDCAVSTFPEVYTRISNYTSWIKTVSTAPSLINPGILALLLLSFLTTLF